MHIECAGPPLRSFTQYSWRVQLWNEDDESSTLSAPAHFETAFFSSASWQAHWISGGRVLKGLLSVDRIPRNSRAHITGIGYYELHINGQRVGDYVLNLGFTNYDKRALYSTYDIAPHLRTGRDEVEITLGDGWQPFDGLQVADGVYYGEDFDATRARSSQ